MVGRMVAIAVKGYWQLGQEGLKPMMLSMLVMTEDK